MKNGNYENEKMKTWKLLKISPDQRPKGVLDLVSKLGGRKAQGFGRWPCIVCALVFVTVARWSCNCSCKCFLWFSDVGDVACICSTPRGRNSVKATEGIAANPWAALIEFRTMTPNTARYARHTPIQPGIMKHIKTRCQNQPQLSCNSGRNSLQLS